MDDISHGTDAPALKDAAKKALDRRDFRSGRDILRDLVKLQPLDISAWLNLAGALRALSDFDGALEALNGALRIDPRNFLALLTRATLIEKQGKSREAATAYGIALSQSPPDSRLDPPTLAAVRRARDINQRHVTELRAFIVGSVAASLGRCPPARGRRLEAFIDITLGQRRRYRQEPAEFYYPGLPAIEFYERDEFPWLAALEAMTNDIRRELLAVLRDRSSSFIPYIAYPDTVPIDQWAELNNSSRWQAFHLLEQGVPVEDNVRHCPITMGAVAALPQPNIPNRSPAAMFSALQPSTRIPPHTGIANTRLVVHLPLVVPQNCGFRVGGETRQWREGEAWVFDDTIEHEAWNDSDQVRAILICDIWNPRLTLEERNIVCEIMVAMDNFSDIPKATAFYPARG